MSQGARPGGVAGDLLGEPGGVGENAQAEGPGRRPRPASAASERLAVLAHGLQPLVKKIKNCPPPKNLVYNFKRNEKKY